MKKIICKNRRRCCCCRCCCSIHLTLPVPRSPLTRSTSIRSGLTWPVFFGLFLKPCRGRQRARVADVKAGSHVNAAVAWPTRLYELQHRFTRSSAAATGTPSAFCVTLNTHSHTMQQHRELQRHYFCFAHV